MNIVSLHTNRCLKFKSIQIFLMSNLDPPSSPSAVAELLNKMCYIYPAVGTKDLRMCVDFERPSLSFTQDESPVDFPRNGFYQCDSDVKRYQVNLDIYQASMKSLRHTVPASLEVIRAFVSVANVNRALCEKGTGKFDNVVIMYENSIRLSGDESAIKMLGLISRRKKTVTFCSTDDEETSIIPEPVRLAVAEAFAGIALCAMHQGRVLQCVGYATAALFKHAASLPMVNCSRLVAVVKRDMRAVLFVTEMVLVPFYLR